MQLVEPTADRVVLAHPGHLRVIAQSKRKTDKLDAQTLAEYAGSLFPDIVPQIVRLGPALGVHAGPGSLIVALREKISPIREGAGEGKPSKKRISLPSLHIPRLRFSCPRLAV